MVIMYSNDCPRCRVIRTVLKQKNIPVQVVSDMDEIMVVAKEYGEMSMPFAVIDGQFYGSAEFTKWALKEETDA